ncbi:hypothetical protein [Candidatus Finniella inopinata]|uniref:Uncharacterized protein n=1 Tax=Candidatus Finniella inopinata TaxID=1696036 RepID=A0A4Q7DFV7_9PROT|nr:hypothetical protein [Candidatus Finniella inopinata]RZI45701.1 hypothetical protein EQU50_06255 [Candidatus Finniella inopinata]
MRFFLLGILCVLVNGPVISSDGSASQQSIDVKSAKRLEPINNVGKNPNYRSYFPQAPVVHAYDPSLFGADLKDFPVIVKFKVDTMRQYLPDEIAKVIHDKNDDNMDLYWVPQIRDTNNPNLMRYHYWLSPNGSTWHRGDVWSRVSKTPSGLTLKGNRDSIQEVNVHDNVSSPDNYSIQDLLPDEPQSLAFWSFVKNSATNRHAVTLHWLLTWSDNACLAKIADSAKNLGDIGDWVSLLPTLSKLYHFAF